MLARGSVSVLCVGACVLIIRLGMDGRSSHACPSGHPSQSWTGAGTQEEQEEEEEEEKQEEQEQEREHEQGEEEEGEPFPPPTDAA